MRLSFLLVVAALFVAAQTKKSYDYFHLGKIDAHRTRTERGFLLAGGGRTPEDAYRWFAAKAGSGDIVTLRASGADAMNQTLIDAGAASASTILFSERSAASDPFVVAKIRAASGVFIAGGDQSKYVAYWKGTPVADALNELIAKGVPVGGSSAGLAILGEFGFSAERDTITSKAALANPFDPAITLSSDFIRIPLLEGVITDTHFGRRDRMGRTLVFLARMVHDGQARPASSIAVDEGNAVLLEPDGRATVSGSAYAYFIRATAAPQVCEAGKPLSMGGFSVYRIDRAGKFDVKTWRGEGGTAYTLSVEAGGVRSTQAGGGLY
jgi:cyanophycinase